jgi:hypothetical protein
VTVDDFPSIQATARSYGWPIYPISSAPRGLRGVRGDFLHGTNPSNYLVQLVFESLLTADRLAVLAHYALARQHSDFRVPATLWQSHPDQWTLRPWSHTYRYSAPPAPTKNGTSSRYTLTVNLLVTI